MRKTYAVNVDYPRITDLIDVARHLSKQKKYRDGSKSAYLCKLFEDACKELTVNSVSLFFRMNCYKALTVLLMYIGNNLKDNSTILDEYFDLIGDFACSQGVVGINKIKTEILRIMYDKAAAGTLLDTKLESIVKDACDKFKKLIEKSDK